MAIVPNITAPIDYAIQQPAVPAFSRGIADRATMIANDMNQEKGQQQKSLWEDQKRFIDMYTGANSILNEPDPAKQDELIKQRIAQGEAAGKDMSETRDFLSMSPEQRKSTFDSMHQLGINQGFLQPDMPYGSTKEGFIAGQTIQATTRADALQRAAQTKLEAEKIKAAEAEKNRQNALDIANLKIDNKPSPTTEATSKAVVDKTFNEADTINKNLTTSAGMLDGLNTIEGILTNKTGALPSDSIGSRIKAGYTNMVGSNNPVAAANIALEQQANALALSAVELMKGSSSDKDVVFVKSSVGDLADASKPIEARVKLLGQIKAALQRAQGRAQERYSQLQKVPEVGSKLPPIYSTGASQQTDDYSAFNSK